jgi:DNA-binding transcriptional ArsR family regulator
VTEVDSGGVVVELPTKTSLEELADLLKSLGHIDRLQIVRLMADGKERSPKMLADFLAPTKLGAVSYHVRDLRDKGLLTVVREEPRRGAIEHFYVLTEEGKRMKKWLRL